MIGLDALGEATAIGPISFDHEITSDANTINLGNLLTCPIEKYNLLKAIRARLRERDGIR